MADFFKIIAPTLHFEGGFQNMPKDPGNYCDGKLIGTMRGIAAATYKQYLFYKKGIWQCPTSEQMQSITEDVAKDIFYILFWKNLLNADKIKDQFVAFICFQAAIGAPANLSVVRKSINKIAAKYNKKTVQETPVAFNDYTVDIINSLPEKELFLQIYNDYLAHLKYIDATLYNNKMVGWYARMNSIYEMAMEGYQFIKENPKTTGAGVAFFLPSDYLDINISKVEKSQLINFNKEG